MSYGLVGTGSTQDSESYSAPLRMQAQSISAADNGESLGIVRADLHRESVRIQDMETESASLLINRSGSPRLEIHGHGVLVEIVDSDREMIHFGGWFTWPQDQKVLTKHELVVT